MELARNESSEHTYGKVQGSDSKNASRAQAAKWKILFPYSMHEHNAGIERESILKFYAFDVQFYSIVDEKKKVFTSATCVNQFIEFRKFNWKWVI